MPHMVGTPFKVIDIDVFSALSCAKVPVSTSLERITEGYFLGIDTSENVYLTRIGETLDEKSSQTALLALRDSGLIIRRWRLCGASEKACSLKVISQSLM